MKTSGYLTEDGLVRISYEMPWAEFVAITAAEYGIAAEDAEIVAAQCPVHQFQERGVKCSLF